MSSSPKKPSVSEQKWPDTLFVVRHGQSSGNVARDAAEAAGHFDIDIATRDMDVPLSPLGERQALALGEWFGRLPKHQKPTVLLASPYVRTQQTAMKVQEGGGSDLKKLTLVIDERLREREFGILDRLTKAGIVKHFPDQAEIRRRVGKFYYRPPGGESWCDVILRLRSIIDTLTRDHRKEKVLIVGHSVVVLCFRYLLERMSEETVLEIDRRHEIANCSVTSYEFDPTLSPTGKLGLKLFNFTAPLEEADEKITRKPDVPLGPK